VLGTSRKAYQSMYPRWADSSARSYAIGLAYLFGFDALQLLGNLGRGAVARKVFGQARVSAYDLTSMALYELMSRALGVSSSCSS
jgi:hypothetical protein